jgi:hypothetical protein
MEKLKIYIASPYTEGDQAQNVYKAILAAEELMKHDFIPFVPHLYHFWHIIFSHEKIFWMELDYEWLKSCQAMLVLGDSVGVLAEIAIAAAHKISIFYFLDHLLEWRERGYKYDDKIY